MIGLAAFGFIIVGVVVFGICGILYARNRLPALRRFPVFTSFPDKVGRVAEEGKIIHIALGKGGLLGNDGLASIVALQSLQSLMDLAAAYDTPPLLTTSDPTLYLLARDWMHSAYVRIGNAGQYRPFFVQFAAATPAAYAAMATTYLFDGSIGSNVMMGAFDQEVSLIAEAAQRQGIESAGGTISMPGLSALYPVLEDEDMVMGEDLFAGPIVSSSHSVYPVSLYAQNALRWSIIIIIIVLAVLSFLGLGGL